MTCSNWWWHAVIDVWTELPKEKRTQCAKSSVRHAMSSFWNDAVLNWRVLWGSSRLSISIFLAKKGTTIDQQPWRGKEVAANWIERRRQRSGIGPNNTLPGVLLQPIEQLKPQRMAWRATRKATLVSLWSLSSRDLIWYSSGKETAISINLQLIISPLLFNL